MHSEGTLKEFLRTTYRSGSPVPYIISAKVLVFVLIYIFDLLHDTETIAAPLFDQALASLSLPKTFPLFLQQPWSLLTYSLLNQTLFELLFDCLWLYWTGRIFLNLLQTRQLLTVYLGAIFLGGFVYLAFGQLTLFAEQGAPYLYSGAVANAAVIGSLLILVPESEIRLFLFGNVRLRTIGLIYLALQLGYYMMVDQSAAGSYTAGIVWGVAFMLTLKQGNDWSHFFRKQKKRTLKVVHHKPKGPTYKSYRADLPNQEVIDEILDKISLNGYDSLSTLEKEILFKASKQEK
ncbi:rhomboid family intramembrane serine protease [Sphingobacterium sp. lm-10]|uniref:rhomboid family intramembrane serine protease n=1 Tax=Sphingobacterium sp. lm-10 TaxID=2944904 RepID=UPI0020203DE0|nr:rhomboid family intramembrane serine protease [Sphingobacterium sp. lm-10]MCL7988713.1 rhomboid family intramembrane serine protease [Sphingobacterium sp. lm-10]